MTLLKSLFLTLLLIAPLLSFAYLPVIDYANLVKTSAMVVKAGQQITNQIDMLRNQALNLKQLSGNQWQKLSVLSSQVDALSQQNSALLEKLNQLNKDYEEDHPELNGANLKKYNMEQTQQSTLYTLHSSLSSLNDSARFMSRQDQLLKNLHTQNQTASGQLQAVQTANSIALENAQQLQNIQKLISAQTQAQIARNAQKAQEEHYNEVMVKEIANTLPNEVPGYKNKDEFGLIKEMN